MKSTLQLPETRAKIKAALAEIQAEGGSVEIVDVSCEAFRDDNVGPFVRLHFHLSDGGHLSVDSLEFDLPFQKYLH